MADANIYQFEDEGHDELLKKKLSDLRDIDGDNVRLKSDLRHFINSLVDLIAGQQREKLTKRGYALVVSGTWGAGKSTATWALVNEVEDALKKQHPNTEPLVTVEKSLLPFGSASGSITTFLNFLAQKLWADGLLDIRAEVGQFILEVAPDAEQDYQVSASLGPLSFSKPVNKKTQSVNAEKLHAKFQRLDKLGKTVMIVLDDLDRLRPAEIVDVMRMVEKLRALPGVIVVLPIYKRIVADAFQHDLNLQPSSAATFLRKLTDAEVFVENGKEELKQMFLDCFDESTKRRFETALQEYSLSVAELCWYMLLHNLILEEALEVVRSEGQPTGNSVARFFDGSLSAYTKNFRELLQESARRGTVNPFPTHAIDDQGSAVFWTLGNYYANVKDNSDANATVNRMAGLLRFDEINKAITTEQSVVEAVTNRTEKIDFNGELEAKSSSPMFLAVLLDLLQKNEDEPLLTENYKLRDMKILAQRIQGDPYFTVDDDPLRTLYGVVRTTYRRFRF